MLEKKQTFNGLRTGNYLRGRVQVRYTHNVVLERNMKKKITIKNKHGDFPTFEDLSSCFYVNKRGILKLKNEAISIKSG